MLWHAVFAQQVAQVFGYHLSLAVDGEQQEGEQQDGEAEQQQPQPLPLAPLAVNLSSSGGRVRAGSGGSGGGAAGLMSPVIRVSEGLAGRLQHHCSL